MTPSFGAKSKPSTPRVNDPPVNSPNSRFMAPVNTRRRDRPIVPVCRNTYAGNVFLGKPHVVRQVAPVDCQQFSRRIGAIERERHALFADGQHPSRILRPLHVEIGKPDIERIVPLRIQLDLDVKSVFPEQRNSWTNAEPPDVPLRVIALVRVDFGEVIVKPATEQHTLHDRIRVVRVPLGKCPPDLVVRRWLLPGGRRLSGCRARVLTYQREQE